MNATIGIVKPRNHLVPGVRWCYKGIRASIQVRPLAPQWSGITSPSQRGTPVCQTLFASLVIFQNE
jgi:hypothetical protein